MDSIFAFSTRCPDAPAAGLAECVTAPFDDVPAIERFLAGVDIVTYEFENVPLDLAQRLAGRVLVYPPPTALEHSQDRLPEKTLFRRLGLPTAPFAAIEGKSELTDALKEIGYPAVIKTRRFGYDGKGQGVIRNAEQLESVWPAFAGVKSIVEGFVRFDRELSQIAVRGRDGATMFYPLVENHHSGGILRLTLAPAPRSTISSRGPLETTSAACSMP